MGGGLASDGFAQLARTRVSFLILKLVLHGGRLAFDGFAQLARTRVSFLIL